MSAPRLKAALNPGQLSLLAQGLAASVASGVAASAGRVAPAPQVEVVIENPSHDIERDTRRFRIAELQGLRRQRRQLQHEFSAADRSCPDYAKLPGWLREAEAKESFLQAQLDEEFLPQHSAEQLISPQLFFMSQLFNVRNRASPRQPLVEFSLGKTSEGEVVYAGPEMRQSDGLVFMALLNLIRDVPVGKRVSFEPSALCTALWGAYNGEARNRLRQCLFRLQHAVVRFPTFSVQLVLRFEFPKRGRWSVVLDQDIVRLFKHSRLVWLDLALRQQLPEGLATWLYAYVSSQTTLIPWPLDKLRESCGSDAQPREFSIVLGRALGKLAGAGVIDNGWSIKRGTVHWRKARAAESLAD